VEKKPSTPFLENTVLLYFLLTVITFLLFYNTLPNEFVFDDESVIVNNSALTDLSNIPEYFTGSEGFHKVIGKYYRPVVSTSYTIDYALWGLKPGGFHFTNILIHITASLILFNILLHLFGNYKNGILYSFIGALIFAVHPVHTEAVSWVSGRTDSMVTLFFFASFLYYLKYSGIIFTSHAGKKENTINPPDHKRFLLFSLIFYVLGLLSKEMIVTMPVIIILFDLVYRKKPLSFIKKNLPVYGLFIGVTIVYVFVRYLILKDIPDRDTYLYFYDKDGMTAFATMMKTIPVYFKLLFFPVGLLYHYNGTMPDAFSLLEVNVLLSVMFIFILLALAVIFYKKDSVISFCILFFFVTLLPVLNIVPTMNFMAERFLYMTSFAVSVFGCYLLTKFAGTKNKNALISIFVIVIIAFAYLTFERNKDWKDNDTLYLSAEGIDGNVLLVNIGNIHANRQEYDAAEPLYRRAIAIRDNSVLANHNLGLIFLIKGELDSAEHYISRGIEIDSLAPDGYFQLASIYRARGNTGEAIRMLEKLQEIIPNYKESAALLQQLQAGNIEGQILPPGVPDNFKSEELNLLQNRSFQYYQEKKYAEAIKDLEKLIEMSDDPAAISGYLNNIGLCYYDMGNLDEAGNNFNEALKLNPQNVNALNGLAEVMLKRNNRAKAMEYYNKILQINPGDENARSKLDSLK
jgi:tetratricopeptide (TPR) repeat protein